MSAMAGPCEAIPAGFEPFTLEFVGLDGLDYRVSALRLEDSEWCVNPWVTGGIGGGGVTDLFVVSHVSGLSLSNYPVRWEIALECVCACAAITASLSTHPESEFDALVLLLKRIIGNAEERDCRLAESEEAHA